MKTYDSESALASVQHLRVASMLSVQNGVLKNEQLAGIFGWEPVLGAAAFVSGEVLPDGPVRFTVNGHLALGSCRRARPNASTPWPLPWSGRASVPRCHPTFGQSNGPSIC